MSDWGSRRTVSDGALQEVAEAMDTLAESTDGLSRNFARGRRQFRVLMVILIVLVAVFIVNVVAVANLADVSRTIRAQTSPASQAASQRRLQEIEHHLISCENNHVDRVVAFLTHKPMPPLAPGCDMDSLSK
jgi:hypothetical protein